MLRLSSKLERVEDEDGSALTKIDSSCRDGDGSVGFSERRLSKTVYKGADILVKVR